MGKKVLSILFLESFQNTALKKKKNKNTEFKNQ